MKLSRLSCALLGAAFLCAIPVLAGNTIKKSLHLTDTVSVHGVTLSPGDYKVEWTTPGPNVQVNILEGHDTVATVPAQVVPVAAQNGQDGYGLKAGKTGKAETLTELFFSGEKYHLAIGNSATSSGKQASRSGS